MHKLITRWEKLPRTIKVVILLPILILLALVCWRQWRIWSIPDIGEPFDTEAFLEPYLNEDVDNAFLFFRNNGLSGRALIRDSNRQFENIHAAILNWKSANWVSENWVLENQELLAESRKELSKRLGFEIRPDLLKANYVIPLTQSMKIHARHQLLEASLQTSEGDLDAAWEGYRAVFNLSRQVRGNCVIAGIIGIVIHSMVNEPFAYYLASPELTVEELRRIQRELDEIYAEMPPASVAFKAEYWSMKQAMMSDLAQPSLLNLLFNEQELTRRSFHLLMENWLSQCDLPRHQRAAETRTVFEPLVNRLSGYNIIPGFDLKHYEISGEQAISAQSSEKMLSCFRKLFSGGAIISKHAVRPLFVEFYDRDEVRRFVVQLQIALHIYHREHRAFPEKLEQLVPDYINELPYDPFGKGEPLRYRREGEHALIYTFGPDGVDNDGTALADKYYPEYQAWHTGDPRYEVFAPGTEAPIQRLEPAKAERE